jgi:hypothetical protein
VFKKEISPDMKEGPSSRKYKTAYVKLKKEIRQAYQNFQGNFKAIQAFQQFNSIHKDINCFGFPTTSDVELKIGTRRYYSRPKLILTGT